MFFFSGFLDLHKKWQNNISIFSHSFSRLDFRAKCKQSEEVNHCNCLSHLKKTPIIFKGVSTAYDLENSWYPSYLHFQDECGKWECKKKKKNIVTALTTPFSSRPLAPEPSKLDWEEYKWANLCFSSSSWSNFLCWKSLIDKVNFPSPQIFSRRPGGWFQLGGGWHIACLKALKSSLNIFIENVRWIETSVPRQKERHPLLNKNYCCYKP